MNSQRVYKLSHNDDHLQNKEAIFFPFQCFLTFFPWGNKCSHYSPSLTDICQAASQGLHGDARVPPFCRENQNSEEGLCYWLTIKKPSDIYLMMPIYLPLSKPSKVVPNELFSPTNVKSV